MRDIPQTNKLNTKLTMRKNLKKLLLCALFLGGLNAFGSDSQSTIAYNDPSETSEILEVNKKKDSIKQQLIDELYAFIKKQAPSAHKMIATYMVEFALKYDLDIAFMAAQTQIETNFGTAGAGRPTSRYSLFGVNGRFKDYRDAVEKYVILIVNNYLVKNKTIQDLLKNYVNKDGHRYATNPSYEKKLNKAYNIIVKNTSLQRLQKEYNKL